MKRSLRIVKRSVELDHLNRAVSSESSVHARQKATSPSLGLDDGSSGELSPVRFRTHHTRKMQSLGLS